MSLRHDGLLGCFRASRAAIRKIMIADARTTQESFCVLVVPGL